MSERLTWRQAIEQVDMTKPENQRDGYGADPELFAAALGLHYYNYSEDFDRRITKRWLKGWMCTDTFVGLAFYLFDGEVIAISWQPARKCDECLYFVSPEAADKMRKVILDLIAADRRYPPRFINLDDEVPDDPRKI